MAKRCTAPVRRDTPCTTQTKSYLWRDIIDLMKKYSVREEISENAGGESECLSGNFETLAFYRGIETGDDAEKFLNPDYDSGIHDPFSYERYGQSG